MITEIINLNQIQKKLKHGTLNVCLYKTSQMYFIFVFDGDVVGHGKYFFFREDFIDERKRLICLLFFKCCLYNMA